MSTYDWTETTWRERTSTGAALETETDNAIIRFHLEDYDGEVRPAFTVETGGISYSTDDPEDWPTIERFVPRAEWPEPMYAGKRGPKERTPDRAVAEAIEQYEAGLAGAQTDSLDPIEGVRAYLGDVDASDEQVAAIAAAFEHAPAELPEDYCTGVIEIVLGDSELREVVLAEAAAARAAVAALERLQGAVNASSVLGVSDYELAAATGRARATVRRWRGETS